MVLIFPIGDISEDRLQQLKLAEVENKRKGQDLLNQDFEWVGVPESVEEESAKWKNITALEVTITPLLNFKNCYRDTSRKSISNR